MTDHLSRNDLTPQMRTALSLGGRLWERQGMRRVYLNDWHELAGLVIHTSRANLYGELDGQRVPADSCQAAMNAKAYVDSDGLHIHSVKGLPDLPQRLRWAFADAHRKRQTATQLRQR